MVFRNERRICGFEEAGIWFVGQPFLVILTEDNRLPLLFLVTHEETEEMTVAELAEEIIERLKALRELLQGQPVAILCNGSMKSFRAMLCAKMSSRTQHSAIFMRSRNGRYRSIDGEDLDDVLEKRYWFRL